MVDTMNAIATKDFEIIQKCISEGRGVIILISKWDLLDLKYRFKAQRYIMKQIENNLGSEKTVPVIFGSVLENKGFRNFKDLILNVYENWNT